MNHSEYKELLSALLDGELNERERAEVMAHLETCEDCRTYLAELSILRDALGEPEDVPVPEDFAAGVMARLHEEKQPRPAKKAGAWHKWGALAACAAIVVLAAATVPNALRMGSSRDAAGGSGTPMAAPATAAPVAPPDELYLTSDAPAETEESAADYAVPEGDAADEAQQRLLPLDAGEPVPPQSSEPAAAGGASDAPVPAPGAPVPEAGVVTNAVTAGPEGEKAESDPAEASAAETPVLILSGEGAAEWLADNGVWSEADGAYRVDNESLDLLPEGLTLEYTPEAPENDMWQLVRAAEPEAAP